MDIYIIRKCRVEMREFAGANGARYELPVMTSEDVHSYVIKKSLNSQERNQIQQKLEDFYTRDNQKRCE